VSRARPDADHYETLFGHLRQPGLDFEPPAAADGAAADVPELPPDGAGATRGAGAEIPFTWTEEHRHACEVRHVQGLDPHARETYLKHVGEKRGAAAAQRLREEDVLR